MAFLFDRLKLVVEPSGAVGVAALLARRVRRRACGVVLSGGNVGVERFAVLLGGSRRVKRRSRRSTTSTTVCSAAVISSSPSGKLPEHPAR